MKVLSLVFMILGCFLGAGFVSGREIASYFSRFGESSWVAIIVAGVIFFLSLFFFLQLSNKVRNFSQFISNYFGKFGSVVTCLFSLSIFILISSMIAGTVSIAKTLNISDIMIVLFTLIISFFCLSNNGKLLSKINFVLMPLILIILLFICGCSFEFSGGDGNVVWAIVSSTNYVLINIVTLGIFVLEIGSKYTVKQKLLASIIVASIIVVFMIVINNVIISNDLIYVDMPVLELAKMQGFHLTIITATVIWCGLFTTIISCVYLLSNFVNTIIGNYKLTVAIILMSALVCSFVGFEFIVSYIYSIIGMIGFLFMIFILKKEKETFCVKVSQKK